MIIIPSSDASYGLTLREMIDQVSAQIRNTTIDNEIRSWLNDEVLVLGSRYRFPDLVNNGYITTIVGSRSYSLPTDFRWLITIYNPDNQDTLRPIGEQELSFRNPNYRTEQGLITHYVLNARNIDLYRVPATVQVLSYTYQSRPLKLVNDTDVSNLPSEWHPLLVLGALKKAVTREERDPNLRVQIDSEYKALRRELEKTVYYRPDQVNVLQPFPHTSRRPWPILDPSRFPRSW